MARLPPGIGATWQMCQHQRNDLNSPGKVVKDAALVESIWPLFFDAHDAQAASEACTVLLSIGGGTIEAMQKNVVAELTRARR